MAQTVSNDALWEKLKEMDEKLDVIQTTEKLKENQIEQSAESAQLEIDTTALKELTQRIEIAVEKAKEPTKVEHRHQHTIDIGSSKVFFSLIILGLIIIGLSYIIGEQRDTISYYKENDLKYRYIKMQGQANEENISRLEHQFQYGDSIKIIRKQVERFEELVKEQAERIERMRKDHMETEQLQKEVKALKIK